MRRTLLLAMLAGAGACNNDFASVNSVVGLRVLGIAAEPPEVAPGQMTKLTALVVDTDGVAVALRWSACLAETPPSADGINPDCVNPDGGAAMVDFGSGVSVVGTMPALTRANLGLPDSTGGIYLPIVARVSAPSVDGGPGVASLEAVYPLRIGHGSAPNHNPTLTGMALVVGQSDSTVGVEEPFFDGTPLLVDLGEKITLTVDFSSDSAEPYVLPQATGPVQTVETLNVAWFASAGGTVAGNGGFAGAIGGSRTQASFSTDAKDTTLHAGSLIDVWAVARDGRGGTAWLHRQIEISGRELPTGVEVQDGGAPTDAGPPDAAPLDAAADQ